MNEMRKARPGAAVAVTVGLAASLALGIGLGDAAVAGAAEQIVAQAASAPDTADPSARPRAHHRPPTRIRVHPRYPADDVYPRYDPGPDAVRDCTATYVQEFRPSGTVITPRMHCVWRRG